MYLLHHSALVSRAWAYIGDVSLLSAPIPVHPYVLAQSALYSEKFFSLVKSQVPEYMRRDLEALEQVGVSIPAVVGNKALRYMTFVLDYEQIDHEVSPGFVSLNYQDFGYQLVLNGQEISLNGIAAKAHPMGSELEKLAVSGRVHVWQVENPKPAPIAVQLYFRNFAIAWNNLGLSKTF